MFMQKYAPYLSRVYSVATCTRFCEIHQQQFLNDSIFQVSDGNYFSKTWGLGLVEQEYNKLTPDDEG